MNYSDPFGLCPNRAVSGLASLQCVFEDVVGTLKASPRLLAQALWSTASDEFVQSLAMVPFTVAGGGVDDVAKAIGGGHAFAKHVLQHGKGGGKFAGLGIRTVRQFQSFVGDVMRNASGADVRTLSRGRTAHWDDATGTVVIRDPRSRDLGTAFRPSAGRSYFEGLR